MPEANGDAFNDKAREGNSAKTKKNKQCPMDIVIACKNGKYPAM